MFWSSDPNVALFFVLTSLSTSSFVPVLYDSKGSSFGIDAKTRPMVPIVELAGTTFIYSPIDDVNTHGELTAPGPTEHEIMVYVSIVRNQGKEKLSNSY